MDDMDVKLHAIESQFLRMQQTLDTFVAEHKAILEQLDIIRIRFSRVSRNRGL